MPFWCFFIHGRGQINHYFYVRPKFDQTAGQLSVPHVGITKTEKMQLKHKTDKQV